jgi:hypothetical protein
MNRALRQRGGQGLRGHGLSEYVSAILERGALDVSAHGRHLHVRPSGRPSFRQLRAPHSRRHAIRPEEVNAFSGPFTDGDPIAAARSERAT